MYTVQCTDVILCSFERDFRSSGTLWEWTSENQIFTGIHGDKHNWLDSQYRIGDRFIGDYDVITG